MAGNMDSELLLKFIGYFPDYVLALSQTLLCCIQGEKTLEQFFAIMFLAA